MFEIRITQKKGNTRVAGRPHTGGREVQAGRAAGGGSGTPLAPDTDAAVPLQRAASGKCLFPYPSDAYLPRARWFEKNADIFIKNVHKMSKYETHQIMKITPYGRYVSREHWFQKFLAACRPGGIETIIF